MSFPSIRIEGGLLGPELLDQELRRQTTACWTDIVPVVRDFLDVWEALEQSRARSLFLHHARPGAA